MEILYILIPAFVFIIGCIILHNKNILKYYHSEIIAFISAYYLFLCDYKKDDFFLEHKKWRDINHYIICIIVIINIASIVYRIWKYKKILNIEEYQRKLENIQDEYAKLCGDYIKIIFTDFFTDSKGQGGRVSIYKIQNDRFILLGRYSNSNEYNKKGRDSYPCDKGFIREGWDKGEFLIYDIPKWTGSGKEYKKFVKEHCNIDDLTLKKIRMKSRSFFIKTIENEKSDSRQDLGIIVFEKMDTSQINSDSIKQVIDENQQQIQALIKTMKTIYEI